MSNLSDSDATKLFNQISKSIKDGDDNKLVELLAEPTDSTNTEQVEEPAETPTPEVPEESATPESKESAPSDDEGTEQPDEKEEKEETPEQLSELELIKQKLEKVTKENQTLRSQSGRVPHLQRRMADLDKKLEDLQKQQSSPSNRPSTKVQEKVLEKLKGISETDAELAKAIAEAIGEATDEVAPDPHRQEIETIKLLREDTSREYREHELNRLLEMYPNAPEVFASTSWIEWEKRQSKGVLALSRSDNADDVSMAFDKYAKDMVAQYPELAPKEEAKPATPVATQNTQAEQIEKERQRRRESTPNLGTPSSAGKVSLPDDPEALFSLYSDQIRKQRQGG